MTSVSVFDGAAVKLTATHDGMLFHLKEVGATATDSATWPAPGLVSSEEALILADLQLLLEQELAVSHGADALLAPLDWTLAVDLGFRSLTAFSAPSHFLLQVERYSELGRKDFRYIQRWREGHREVAITRAGPYVQHDATGRLMHLDTRTVSLVEGMDNFNALPDGSRGVGASWEAFGHIREDAVVTGALLDEYLRSNTVIIPTSIGLTVRDHGDGSISFEPRVADLPDAEAFATKFMQRQSVGEVESLTDVSGQRVRVLFSEPQREVLRRMSAVRKIRGPDALRLSQDPAAVFDGVADAIDLTSIEREYGPRVIGVGALKLPSDSHNDAGIRITDLLGVPRPADARADDPSSIPEAAAPGKTKRSAISIDVLDAVTQESVTIRLPDEDALSAARKSVSTALAAGDSDVDIGGRRIQVEPALLKVLESHAIPANVKGHAEDVGVVGRTGHLYLLIDEHEDTLTAALLVPADTTEEALRIEPGLPVSLLRTVQLQPHQREGLRWLASTRNVAGRRGGILADDMGLGKTLQLLAHIAHLIETKALNDSATQGANGPWRPVLVVAPLLLVESGTWTEEMQRHFADDGRIFEPWVVLRDEGITKVRYDSKVRDYLGKPLLDPSRIMQHKVVITTYDTLVSYQHSLAQRIDGRPLWSLVVFDEAQRVKSPATKMSYAAKAVDAQFKIAATGTPVETRLRDLWNLLDTVEPTRLGTQRDFIAAYERPAQNGSDAGVRHGALDRLRKALRYQEPGAFLLRRDKSILPFLPPRVEHRPMCAMTPEERSTHSRLLSAMHGKNALRALQGLHLASQHPVLVDAPDSIGDPASLVRSSSRLQALVAILRDIEQKGEKVLIFARSVDAQRLLAHVLGTVFNRRIDVINGETGAEAGRASGGTGAVRRHMLQRFRTEPGFGAIILSPFVAGVGLTLVEANHVVHYGRWWNPAVESQATDRVFRIGQKRPVHVYYPILTDPTGEIAQTFDQALDTLITSRRGLATDFLSPNIEEEQGAALLATLSGARTAAATTEGDEDAAQLNEVKVASLVVATAEARGEPAVWLGAAGRLGAHVLRRERGHVQAIRVAQSGASIEQHRIRSAAESWSDVFPGTTFVPLLVARDEEREGLTDSQQWSRVVIEARNAGISVADGCLPPHEVTDAQVIKRALLL